MNGREVVFVRTRYVYPSYTDFWRLVELSGYSTVYVDEIRLDEPLVYVTTPINGELYPHVRNERTRLGGDAPAAILVWWLLERPDATNEVPVEKRVSEALGYVEHAWVSDRLVASFDARFRHVVLGSHPGLRDGGEPEEKTYDYCHMSYAWGRREHLYGFMRARGLREGPAAWGAERAKVLAASRLMVNAQQYTLPVVAPLRFALAAAYKMPLLTEALHDPFPLVRGQDFDEATIHEMPEKAVEMLRRPDIAIMGERLYERLCVEWTFRRGVSNALAATMETL